MLSAITILEGLPFINTSFRSSLLLRIISGLRRNEYSELFSENDEETDWLEPERALCLRQGLGLESDLDMTPLLETGLERVNWALRQLRSEYPHWVSLFDLPMRYHLLVGRPGVMSCSCYLTPQRVFLSRETLNDNESLIENVLHEFAHNWMYLLEELGAFHHPEKNVLYTLPSGTMNRNPTEVIGAAHVAATIAMWYARPNGCNSQKNMRKMESMAAYSLGCTDILASMPTDILTQVGFEISNRLTEESYEISQVILKLLEGSSNVP